MELARSKDEIFEKLEQLYTLYQKKDNREEEKERLKIAIYSILWTCSYSLVDVMKDNDDNFDMYMKYILKYKDLNLVINFENVV